MITQFFQKNNSTCGKNRKSLYYRKNSGKGSEKMRILFLEYPKCSTCKKAKAWLTENGVAFDDRHIVGQPYSRGIKGMVGEKRTAAQKIFQYKRSGL